MARGSGVTSVMSAASAATSVPVPMAIPRSAVTSAGASFTPSPAMATTSPACISSRTTRDLSSGKTSLTTSSMPSVAATACAGPAASPVSMIGRRPSSRSMPMACALSGRTMSFTSMRPASCPSTVTRTVVFDPAAPSSARPTCTWWPSTSAVTPTPACAANAATGSSAPCSAAASVMARPMGCSLPASAAPASASTRWASRPGAGRTSATFITPSVSVPVLSSTATVTRRVLSSTSGPPMRIPSSAPRPVPTISATGVARPSAHGHEMTSTATAAVMASPAG